MGYVGWGANLLGVRRPHLAGLTAMNEPNLRWLGTLHFNVARLAVYTQSPCVDACIFGWWGFAVCEKLCLAAALMLRRP